jgi:hypothetical protein
LKFKLKFQNYTLFLKYFKTMPQPPFLLAARGLDAILYGGQGFFAKKNKYPGRHWLSKPESLSTERVGMVSIRGSCMEAGIMGSMCGKTAHAKPE